MIYSKGISWLDDTRIPFCVNEPDGRVNKKDTQKGASANPFTSGLNNGDITTYKSEGRFTPNLLVCDDMLNDGSVSKGNDNKWYGGFRDDDWAGYYKNRTHTYSDKGSNSRYYDIDLWFNKMIDGL